MRVWQTAAALLAIPFWAGPALANQSSNMLMLCKFNTKALVNSDGSQQNEPIAEKSQPWVAFTIPLIARSAMTMDMVKLYDPDQLFNGRAFSDISLPNAEKPRIRLTTEKSKEDVIYFVAMDFKPGQDGGRSAVGTIATALLSGQGPISSVMGNCNTLQVDDAEKAIEMVRADHQKKTAKASQ